METRVRVGDREFLVRLTPDGGGFAATVGGAAHSVDGVIAGPRWVTPSGPVVEELVVTVDGRPHRVFLARDRERILVALDGAVHVIETGEAVARGAESAGRGSRFVNAPMPGKIVAVLVAVGDLVEAGQPVVVLEAMKMEVTLRTEIAGRVAVVRTAAGAMVDGGAVLVEIAPVETE